MGGWGGKRDTSCPYFAAGVGHKAAIVVRRDMTDYYCARKLALRQKMKHQLRSIENLLQLSGEEGQYANKKRLLKWKKWPWVGKIVFRQLESFIYERKQTPIE